MIYMWRKVFYPFAKAEPGSGKPYVAVPAFIKTIFFGFAIGFVGCYKGYNSNRGTESVGVAANSAVVSASLWIILLDAIAVQLTSVFAYN